MVFSKEKLNLNMILIGIVKAIFNNVGLDIKRFPTQAMKSRQKFMEYGKYDIILDVGANIGQYVREVRGYYEYKGKIISFEPIKDAFQVLSQRHKKDHLWQGFNLALGDQNISDYINISGHSASSSFLNFNDKYLDEHKDLATVGRELIQIVTLDSVYGDLVKSYSNKVLLKIDTQGYEMNVLRGADKSLKHISGLQIEISVREVYKGEVLLNELLTYLKELGFRVFTLEPYYFDKATGELLQVEVYLVKE